MAENVELAKAFVTIVPTTKDAEQNISEALIGAVDKPSAQAGDKAGQGLVASMLSKVGITLPAGMATTGMAAGAAGGTAMLTGLATMLTPAAIGVAIAGIGTALFSIGETFDSAFDSIRTGTGATGEALEELQQSAKNVYGSTVGSIEDVSQTLADLNTRTGATGAALEDMTTKFMQLDEIGYSLDVSTATGAFNAWGISAEDMGSKLDEMFIVSQSTGIGMDELASSVGSNAAVMQELGFSFEETASMAGLLDKAGLDANGMMGKLSRACVNLAKDGEQPAEAYSRIVDEMQGFIDSGDTASAMNLATDLFGTKGAGDFIQALQTGALNMDDLTASLENAGGSIEQNAKDTRDFAENAELLKNKAMELLEPLGSAVFGALGDALGYIVELTERLSPLFEELSPLVQGVADIIGGVFATALDTVTGLVDDAISSIEFFKGLFTGELEFPHIKVPHIDVDGGEIPWGIGGMGTKPTVSIEWYAKGGIATGASLIGVGEAGNEAIVPLQGHYMQPFAKAVAEQSGQDALLAELKALRNDIQNLKIVLDSGALVGGIARKMDTQLGKMATQGAR